MRSSARLYQQEKADRTLTVWRGESGDRNRRDCARMVCGRRDDSPKPIRGTLPFRRRSNAPAWAAVGGEGAIAPSIIGCLLLPPRSTARSQMNEPLISNQDAAAMLKVGMLRRDRASGWRGG